MIDGQGHVRIMDFGLATVSVGNDEIVGMSGTPAYMAPEQLLRGEMSVQTDIYSLGLVLFELVTGEHANQGASIDELRQLHMESGSGTSPSSRVDDTDPALDRIIARCLEPEPVRRPRSMTEVIGGLPGNDPLAAALAAGETPSPALIAASGSERPLSEERQSCG